MSEEQAKYNEVQAPRFKPGDTVWLIDDNKVQDLEVKGIAWNSLRTTYHLGQWAKVERLAHEVFATREGLIKSL